MSELRFEKIYGELLATDLWRACLVGIDPRLTFGPEVPTIRPRSDEECFIAIRGDGVTIGMWGLQWPTPTTARVWAAILPEHRGQGWGVPLQRARVKYLFTKRNAKKVEYGVYTSNPHSIHVSSKSDTMKVEGVLKDHIEVDGIMYDCVLFGVTLPEWKIRSDTS